MAILDVAGRVFRWAAGAIAPMFARPTSPVGLAWVVHVVLVSAVAVGLYFVQTPSGIRALVSRGPHQLHPFWLPIMFVLVYALGWSAAWLWALLRPGQATTIYPDIDDAWNEIRMALEHAGIGLADTPVFLVFGEYLDGFEPLFRALPGGLVVAGGSSAGSPVRAFAHRDGIYLAVPGASLLGVQGWLAENEPEENGSGIENVMGRSIGVGASIGIDPSMSMSIGGGSVATVGGNAAAFNEIQRIVRRAREEKNRPLTEAERQRVRELSASGSPQNTGKAQDRAGGGSVLQNPRLLTEGTARLQHLCGLVAAARWPLCPINGALVVVPASVCDRDDKTQQWGLVAREDLARAEAALRLRFPVFVLLGGLEQWPGGTQFFEQFTTNRTSQRLGKGFPLNPDLHPNSCLEEIQKATNWAFGSLLPYHLFKLMRTDGAIEDARENAGLFRFLVELRRRSPRLARLVSRAVTTHDDEVPVFGGCYAAVTLPSEPGDAKFAREFFRKVEASQGAVAWTPAAYEADTGYRSATRLGYLVLGLVWVAVTALAFYTARTHLSVPGT